MKKRDGSLLGVYFIGVAALFLAGFMLLVVFGATTYCDAVEGQQHNNQMRALRSYLTTCAQSNRTGHISVQEGEAGSMLVISEDDNDYELRIYQHKGHLVEDYGDRENGLDPENASQIADTKLFQIEKLSKHAVAVRTDAGRTILRI